MVAVSLVSSCAVLRSDVIHCKSSKQSFYSKGKLEQILNVNAFVKSSSFYSRMTKNS